MTNPPTDERREAFEKWFYETHRKGWLESSDAFWMRDGDYGSVEARVAWSAYKAALSHQGEALYEVENSGLRKGLKLGYEMGQEGLSELFNTTLASWEREAKEVRQENHLTALISKAEKV